MTKQGKHTQLSAKKAALEEKIFDLLRLRSPSQEFIYLKLPYCEGMSNIILAIILLCNQPSEVNEFYGKSTELLLDSGQTKDDPSTLDIKPDPAQDQLQLKVSLNMSW